MGGDLSKQNTVYNDIVYKVLSTHTEFEREREKKNEETLNAKRCHIRTDGKTNEKFRFYLEEFCGPWSQKNSIYIYPVCISLLLLLTTREYIGRAPCIDNAKEPPNPIDAETSSI